MPCLTCELIKEETDFGTRKWGKSWHMLWTSDLGNNLRPLRFSTTFKGFFPLHFGKTKSFQGLTGCKIQSKRKATVKFMPHNPDAGLRESWEQAILLCKLRPCQVLSTTGVPGHAQWEEDNSISGTSLRFCYRAGICWRHGQRFQLVSVPRQVICVQTADRIGNTKKSLESLDWCFQTWVCFIFKACSNTIAGHQLVSVQ